MRPIRMSERPAFSISAPVGPLFEPQEGHYAWKEDANFQALVAGRSQQDCSAPATPLWVQAAGAQGYTEKGQGGRDLWTPTITDLVFRQKLENFVKAFAQEFDDPSRVDFIDGCGLGWWGEMDHLNIPSTECPQTLKWICETYGHSFHHVLLGIQINSELSQWGALDNIPLNDYGYVARRDGLGSSWLSEHDREKLSSIYPQIPFYGESCYFSLDSWDIWKKDRRHFETIHDVLQATFDDAMTYHANTLDLRAPHDAALWNKEAPDLVTSFIANAGYRLAPTTIQYPAQFAVNQPFTIQYAWRNLGSGVMPNDNLRWGKKYRVGFALLNVDSKKPVATAIDPSAESRPLGQRPGLAEHVQGQIHSRSDRGALPSGTGDRQHGERQPARDSNRRGGPSSKAMAGACWATFRLRRRRRPARHRRPDSGLRWGQRLQIPVRAPTNRHAGWTAPRHGRNRPRPERHRRPGAWWYHSR